MAHTKAAGVTKLGRESESKRLGVKTFAGQVVKIGNILIRQRGTKYIAGKNTTYGNDDTIYAMKDGLIKFTTKMKTRFDGTKRSMKVIHVV